MSPRIDYDVPCSLSVAGSSSDSASLPCYFLKPKCVSVSLQAIVRSFLSLCRFLIVAIKADGASSPSHPHSLSLSVSDTYYFPTRRGLPQNQKRVLKWPRWSKVVLIWPGGGQISLKSWTLSVCAPLLFSSPPKKFICIGRKSWKAASTLLAHGRER